VVLEGAAEEDRAAEEREVEADGLLRRGAGREAAGLEEREGA
jgi:hypothetical protein